MVGRETLIALRARHKAYRIAVDFLFPHLELQRPPKPQVVFAPTQPHFLDDGSPSKKDLYILTALGLFIATMILVALTSGWIEIRLFPP